MTPARIPHDEASRLEVLHSFDVLDTSPETAFDDLARLAATACGVPIALVGLLDAERQWFKSKVGLDIHETPRDAAFGAHAILHPDEVFVVKDALQDGRFADNPLVTGAAHVRFYAGAPLVGSDRQPVGTLCLMDTLPRDLDGEQVEMLRVLANQVVAQLELRRSARHLARYSRELQRTQLELDAFNKAVGNERAAPPATLVPPAAAPQPMRRRRDLAGRR